MDRILTPRLMLFTERRAQRTSIAFAVAFLALSMFPLALAPWGVAAPAFGMVAFGLALMARDGLMAVITCSWP